MYGKGFLGNMTENLQADCVQSRQAGFMQCFPYSAWHRLSLSHSSKRQTGHVNADLKAWFKLGGIGIGSVCILRLKNRTE